MSSGLEAVGDATTGAVIAQAVEPSHGHSGQDDGGACLNCGTILAGPYCHVCGQNSHLHRTISGFLHDLLHGVFHFEGKIWATLPMLLLRPGALTRRYIAGERAKFVSPMAMFLFCVFLMFAIVGSLAGEMHTSSASEGSQAASLSEIGKTITQNDATIARLERQIADARRDKRDTRALTARLDDLRDDNEKMKTAQGLVSGGKEGDGIVRLNLDTGWSALDHGIAAANENPNLFLYRLQSSAYKYSWLLIPISTPLVWLLFFWKRQYKFYDHLVFVTFSITFMLLFVTALTILSAVHVPGILLSSAALILPPLHLYRQVRGAYASRRITALIRTAALIVFAFVALLIYLAILLAMGIMH